MQTDLAKATALYKQEIAKGHEMNIKITKDKLDLLAAAHTSEQALRKQT
jgi:hypothetical protein